MNVLLSFLQSFQLKAVTHFTLHGLFIIIIISIITSIIIIVIVAVEVLYSMHIFKCLSPDFSALG